MMAVVLSFVQQISQHTRPAAGALWSGGATCLARHAVSAGSMSAVTHAHRVAWCGSTAASRVIAYSPDGCTSHL
jgi:hypothetical protein